MPELKPWHQVAVPREDLRKGSPLDAAEFAIHLDQVMDGRAPLDYREPERFFARTYFTKAYRELTVEVLRRLAGEVVGTSPGINLVTQFGGGKTHFLTLLYHLFKAGDRAKGWPGSGAPQRSRPERHPPSPGGGLHRQPVRLRGGGRGRGGAPAQDPLGGSGLAAGRSCSLCHRGAPRSGRAWSPAGRSSRGGSARRRSSS
jgi:hypothetical protein